MSDSFEATMLEHKNAFQNLYRDYTNNTSASKEDTSVVDKQLFDFYQQTMDILADIRSALGIENPEHDRFFFLSLKKECIVNSKSGSITARLVDSQSDLPIVGATITTSYHDKVAQSNQTGRFYVRQLPAGTYSLMIIAAGYEPLEIEGIEVLVGTRTTLKPVDMVPFVELEQSDLEHTPPQEKTVPSPPLVEHQEPLLANGHSSNGHSNGQANGHLIEYK